ncbi:serine/threonine-protein kinase pim-1-like [Oratosquilla oratoria]|uniref:serine/threonine-protein kinase pim-1-like n=1 Tax=Oratosquilla oratoria TaxID=337810 RepID=UPI003F76598A
MAEGISREMNGDDNGHWRTRFEVQETLGKGGFGCVYLATSLATGNQVAIKEVPLCRVHTWGRRQGTRVPMEASLLQKVQDIPGVIELYDCFTSDGNYYMVMELVPKATSLYDHMKKCGKLPLKDDPSTGEYGTKLINFGCGERITSYKGRHTGGTTIYWPPEYIAKGKFLHVPATVWSLGTLLYYLVCQDDPFYDEEEIQKAQPPFPDDLPRQCRDLIMKCFMTEPWERPTLHGILSHPWLRNFGHSKDGDRLEDPDPKLFPPQFFKKAFSKKKKRTVKRKTPTLKKRDFPEAEDLESTPPVKKRHRKD